MRLSLEHLPADVLGLSDLARGALAEGALGGLPVVRKLDDLERPTDRHAPAARQLLVADLRRGLESVELHARARTSLEVLGNTGTFCVVTGQQPGFLCSPLYSLYKALQACRLAHELSSSWGTPVVPLFWNHADDHDVAEVHHAYLLTRNFDVQKVVLAGLSSGRQPLSRIVLDEEEQALGATRELLAQMQGGQPQLAEALELFLPRSGEKLPRAFSRAFCALLGEHGLLVMEPDWIRTALSRALADVVSSDPLPALREGSGAEPAIDPETAALVYHVDQDGRRALRAGGEGFRYDGEAGSRSPAELAAEIVQDTPAWSPGALLRPLVQDAALPVCAYVGGYGELGYHAQLGPLRDALGLPRTPFVPRISITLVDPELRALLAREKVSVRTALEAGGELRVQDESEDGQPAVIGSLRALAEDSAQGLLDLRPALAELEPALAANLRRTADQMRALVEKVAAKCERVHANKSGVDRRRMRRVNHTLCPRGTAQERILGPLQFCARYGPEWIEALYAEMPAVCTEHLVVHIREGDEA
ncbi:MAG: bacillithiol biosynthesis BshC [Planctomycetota bacterium]